MPIKDDAQNRYQHSEKGIATRKARKEKNLATEGYSEKRLAYVREWQKANPINCLIVMAKQRAKKRGLEFSIKKENITIPDICPVLGIPLKPGSGVGGHCDSSPTLDRVDNSKGYVVGNIRVISFRANTLKSDATIEEIEKILNYMKSVK